MRWVLSWRADPVARRVADRHYNRQKVGAAQFVPPGRCVVLMTACGRALWVTSWPRPEYVKHRWPGLWVCSAFRNEAGRELRSSELTTEALAATRAELGDPPRGGMVTFVDPRRVKHKRDPGRCFIRAGFKPDGETEGGLLAFRIPENEMPAAVAPLRAQMEFSL